MIGKKVVITGGGVKKGTVVKKFIKGGVEKYKVQCEDGNMRTVALNRVHRI